MPTYIKILLTLILCSVLYHSSAQTINHFGNSDDYYTPKPPGSELIDGTRNLYDDFRIGEIYYKVNGAKLQVPLRFNIYNDEFEYIKNDTVYSLGNFDLLDKIVFENKIFIYIVPDPDESVSGFVIKRNTDLPAIITKMDMRLYAKEKSVFGYKPKRFEREEDRHYIMNADGKIERIKSVKELIKYLSSHQEELSKFAKEEKISANDPKKLAKLLDFFQDLEHQSPL